ncbi:MAG: DNA repair protein RadC [Ruminococcaceae bacterium]|jgi:DNA repair protein RadC|nr:DNA repair protein RadC [Oscillospiraceae bacterium]
MGVHDGHRKRTLDAFLENGVDRMQPHQILEMLLFFAIPRRDTNPLAHELIAAFGSLRAVFDAPYEELIKIKGMGEYSATLIKMVPELARAYLNTDDEDVIVSSSADAAACMLPAFVGRTRETVFLLCLDNKNKVLANVMVGEGSVNSASLSIRAIVEAGMKRNAAAVVLAHNHPGGTALPSRDDVETTRMLNELCASIHMPLLDHIVVSDGDYVSMAETGLIRGFR